MNSRPTSAPEREELKIVIVGHVDHGKSTLVGRLLYETDSLPPGKVEELKAISARRGMAIEWSFVLAAFPAERDQAVTIDTAQAPRVPQEHGQRSGRRRRRHPGGRRR